MPATEPADKRYLIVTPDNIALAILKPERSVAMRLDLNTEQAGLLGIDVVIRMTPTEARRIAQRLIHKADEAEAGLPRA